MKRKSTLRSADGMELMTRFAKRQPIRAEDGFSLYKGPATAANNALAAANMRDGLSATTGMYGQGEVPKEGAHDPASTLSSTQMAMPSVLQLRDGGEIHAESGFTGGHRSPIAAFGDMWSSLPDLPSLEMKDMLPAPTLMGTPRRVASQQTGAFGMQREGANSRFAVPANQQVATGAPQGSALPAAPAPAPATPDSFAQNLTTTGREGFLARNPQMKARYEAERNRGYNPNASPSTSAAPLSLREQGVEKPWKTMMTSRSDSAGAPIMKDIYRSGNSYSDTPSHPMETAQSAQNAQARDNMLARTQNVAKYEAPQYRTEGNYNDPMSQRTVRMAAGGEVHAADGFLGAIKGMFTPQPQAAPQPGLAQAHAARLRAEGGTWGNVGGGSAAPAPAPSQGGGSGISFQTARAMKEMGLRNGGTYQDGQGGRVPGKGKGDKFPAKYEAGEFVVSNDMLEAEPGLRDHLRGLREEVLADKGMTVAEADAKAVTGSGLRAAGSFSMPPFVDLTLDDLPQTQAPAQAPPPVQAGPTPGQLRLPNEAAQVNARAARQATEAARQADVLDYAKANAGKLQREAIAAMHGDGRYGIPADTPAVAPQAPAPKPAPTTRLGKLTAGITGVADDAMALAGKAKPMAMTALKYAPLAGGVLETGASAANGDVGRTALGAAATAGLLNPITAPFAGTYLGARALTDVVSGIANKRLDDKTRDMLRSDPLPAKPKAAPAAAGPKELTDAELQAKNQAMIAAADADWKKFNGPAELGATRRADREGNLLPEGQEMVYTGPKMGWQQQTSAEHKAKLNADRVKWQAEDAAAAEASRAQTKATLDRFALKEAFDQPMTHRKRAALVQMMGNQMQDATLRENAKLKADVDREQTATLRRGQDLDYEGKMIPMKITQANQKLLRGLASHPSTNGGDPALMAAALTKMGRGDLADAYGKQASETMSRAKSSDDLTDNKWKSMREMFAYSSPDKDGKPEVSKALNDRAYARLKRTNPTAYDLKPEARSRAVQDAIADEELMAAFGNPEDGGFASLVPRFLSQNEMIDPTNDIPGPGRLRGAKVGSKIGGLRGALTPNAEAGDRFLELNGNFSDVNLGKLSADAIARMQYYIDQANATPRK